MKVFCVNLEQATKKRSKQPSNEKFKLSRNKKPDQPPKFDLQIRAQDWIPNSGQQQTDTSPQAKAYIARCIRLWLFHARKRLVRTFGVSACLSVRRVCVAPGFSEGCQADAANWREDGGRHCQTQRPGVPSCCSKICSVDFPTLK